MYDVQAIGAGHHHTLSAKTDNEGRSWGRNYRGQLGIGDTPEDFQTRAVAFPAMYEDIPPSP